MKCDLDVRIYLVLGEQDYHLGLLEAMHQEGLFSAEREDEEYFVVGINSGEAWDAKGKFRIQGTSLMFIGLYKMYLCVTHTT